MRYYTAQQVLDLLQIPTTTLYAMIHDGRLHAELPPGRRRGYRFVPAEIDALAQAQGGGIPALVVRTATEADLAQVVALSLDQVGAAQTVRWPVWQAWRAALPTQFVVVSAGGVIVMCWGRIGLVPLRPAALADLRHERRTLAALTAQEYFAGNGGTAPLADLSRRRGSAAVVGC